MIIQIHDKKYSVGDRGGGRVEPIGDLITPNNWVEVKTPRKFYDEEDSLIQSVREYQRFNDWFNKKCVGYYQYLYRGIFLFSEEEDVIRYYLDYYYS